MTKRVLKPRTKEVELTPEQFDFVSAPEKFPCFCGGFGSGKTHAGIMRAIAKKLQYPRLSTGYYLPTYDLVRKVGFPRFAEAFDTLEIPHEILKGDNVARVFGAGEIIFRTMDTPERIIGYEVADSIVDELDTLKPAAASDAWNKIIGRNRQKKPDGAINTVGVATTPEGFRFVYDRWGRRPTVDYRLIKARTSSNAHNLPADYMDSLRDTYPSVLLAAYLEGEFVNFGDAVMRREWLREGVPPHGCTIVQAVDLAISTKEGADYTAVVTLSRVPDGTIFVLDVERRRMPFREALQFIEGKARQFNPAVIAIETVQFQAAVVQELLRTTTLPVRGVRPEKDKLLRFQPVLARYEHGQIRHDPKLPEYFIDELLSFPEGPHDDMIDALSYAFAALPATLPQAATAGARIFGVSNHAQHASL